LKTRVIAGQMLVPFLTQIGAHESKVRARVCVLFPPQVYMDPLKKIQVEGYSMFAEPELLFGNLDELCCVSDRLVLYMCQHGV